MWFKNLHIYRLLDPGSLSAERLMEGLEAHAFATASAVEAQVDGFVPPRAGAALLHQVGKQWLVCLQTEKKLLPSSVINQYVRNKAAIIAEEQGYPPGRKRMKLLKDEAVDALLPRAFGVQRQTCAWFDTEHGWLVVDAASPTRAEEVLKALLKAQSSLPVVLLRTQISPVAAMTGWLAADAAPKGFTVDQDGELRAPGEEKATIRYVRHTLEAAEMQRQLAAGKQCTRLALTWNDHVSFVLGEQGGVKRIKPLDILDELGGSAEGEEERFDADFLLMARELHGLLDDLVFALGGALE